MFLLVWGALAGDVDHGAAAGVRDPALAALLEDHWEQTMRASPVWATALGDHRFDDQVGDGSAEAHAAWLARTRAWLDGARALTGLSDADQLTADLWIGELEDTLAVDVCRMGDWAVSARDNPLGEGGWIAQLHTLGTVTDLDNLLARYRGFAAQVDVRITRQRSGLADGLVPIAASTRQVVAMLDTELALPVDDRAMALPLAGLDAWKPGPARKARAKLVVVLGDVVEPALRRYRAFLADDVVPVARPDDQAGLTALPIGEACYAALAHSYTGVDRTPAELHALGLRELEAIHAELRALGARLWQTDDLAAIVARLRTDPALYFTTRDEVRAKAEEALQRAREAIPGAFGRLPEAACVVEPVPDFEAPYTTIAYYRQPDPTGARPGTYHVNTWAPETRPRFEAEVLAFHEAIPGHHLQIAIAQELPGLPAFRRHQGSTAFVEGWALYTERLADELGLYSSDLDRIGMLSFDAWRASRLVVDTGLHTMGWSRDQAEAFLSDNTALTQGNVRNEVDRYVNTPGQALAYKVGQVELRALREEAEQALGDGFDLAAFHDVVLGGGAVVLPVLRRRVRAWIAGR